MIHGDIKLSTKLGAAFFALVLLTAGLGLFSLRQLAAIHEHMEEVAENSLPSVDLIGKMRLTANRIRRAEADNVLARDAKERTAAERRIDELKGRLSEFQASYEKVVSPGEERQAYDRYRQHRDAYFAELGAALAAARSGEASLERAKSTFERTAASFDTVADDLTQLGEINMKAADVAREGARSTYDRAHAWAIGLVIAAIALATGLAVLIIRGITRQLGGEPAQAAALARSVAAGDLCVPIQLRPGDDSSMMAQLRAMQTGLSKLVSGVRQNADSVATASAQIAQGNADLSSRTEEQASALQQTAASMEQLGSTVNQNADNAKQANQLALGASTLAARGGEVVGEVVETMKGIHDSSRRIADIIGVIDGIAFQTNILALNAAVEAARAGEQGRGFAVVAGEVRTLAQRSAEAAKEIKGLIGASVERVERGTSLVDQAGSTMTEIVGAVRRVADIVSEISAATVEQSAGVGQVGDAVTQMDQATQQNAALVEESAAAAESLKQQAQQLARAMATFKVAAGEPLSQAA
ncbi:MAG TPA: methyl-accepting chemotaxis protein [Burkholderiaceae bacterium]